MPLRNLKAALLLALLIGSVLLVYTPTATAQAVISYDMQVQDATVELDVRPGADGIGCTLLLVTNTGNTVIDVLIQLQGAGVTLSPSALTVTLNIGEDRSVPVCALAQTRASYKNVNVMIDGTGNDANTGLGNVKRATSFTAQIKQFARLSLRTELPFQRIGPGNDLPIQFIVKNDGNYIDDVAIAVTNQDTLSENGFSVVLATNLVSVDAQAEQPFSIGIQTPRSTVIDWYNEYHTITVEVRTTMAGSTESRTLSATLWVRGVFLPGFDPIFTIMALGLVATALARKKKDE